MVTEFGSFEIKGIEEAKRMVSSKFVKEALAKAIYETAKDIKQAEIDEMKEVFDRPTPYTLNSLQIRTSKSELTGEVGFKDFAGKGTPAGKYLQPEVFGGGRGLKRSEKILGSYWVPGPGLKLDRYGNVSGGTITRILSQLRLFSEVGYTMNRRGSGRGRNPSRIFLIRKGSSSHLHPGVWEAKGRSIKPLLLFVDSPQYSARLKFADIGKKVIKERMQTRFSEAIKANI